MDAYVWTLIAVAILLLVSLTARRVAPVSLLSRALTADQESEIRSTLEGGGVIEAIRRHRAMTGGGLKAAKDAVEALLASSKHR